MIKKLIACMLPMFILVGCLSVDKNFKEYTQYVNPFISGAANGHTFPGACYPLGIVHPGPNTVNKTSACSSAYMHQDDSIQGFSQIHLNRTGCQELGHIQLQPFSGEIERVNYHSKYKKAFQSGTPGYYAVTLDDFAVNVEITASPRVAFHRYTYNKKGRSRLLVDLQYGIVSGIDRLDKHTLNAGVTVEDHYTISGHNKAEQWVSRHYYYVIKFDKPFTAIKELPGHEHNKAPRYVLDFDLTEGEQLQIKVAMSTLSVERARENMTREIKDWNFAKVCSAANSAWNSFLSRAVVTGTQDQLENFYTSMYHLFVHPNNLTDTDGQYGSKPDGFCSNDECGQISDGLIFSVMGFNPYDDGYVFGAPQMQKIVLRLARGKTFTVEAQNLSEKNKYIQSATLNGQVLDSFKITHNEIMQGGNLIFQMGAEPLR